MNKPFLLAILLSLVLLCSFNAFGTSSIENTSIAGNDLNNLVVLSDSFSLNEQLVSYQENNAENIVQLGNREITVEQKKQRILDDTSFIWKLIAGEFRMILEIIKVMFYIIEIYVFMFFIFKVIPNMMIKIREVIINWYKEKKEL